MSQFHCSCGFAIDDPESFADHLVWVFDRNDDIGTDGHPHAEITHPNSSTHQCHCGYATTDPVDLNDHLLLVVIPPDNMGLDGARHVPIDPTTPSRWYVSRPADN